MKKLIIGIAVIIAMILVLVGKGDRTHEDNENGKNGGVIKEEKPHIVFFTAPVGSWSEMIDIVQLGLGYRRISVQRDGPVWIEKDGNVIQGSDGQAKRFEQNENPELGDIYNLRYQSATNRTVKIAVHFIR